jgi:hypothetical protein
MAGFSNARSKKKPHTIELWLDEDLESSAADDADSRKHRLDQPDMAKLRNQLLSWYYDEREKQAVNRYQQSIDHDFYDSIQWSEDDAAEIEDRCQAPLVFNEVAPMCDWVMGTQRRTRVDWHVLPRSPEDVTGADLKTKVLKYVSDINKVPFARSRAFDDAVKVGVGWMEDGARNDPTKDILYSGYEDWRNMLWDSCAHELDTEDGRYQYRWRWVDLDVSLVMYPDRKAQLRAAAMTHQLFGDDDDDFYYMGQRFNSSESGNGITRRTYTGDAFHTGTRRQRVKLIECWYRVPTRCQICYGDVYDGQVYDEKNSQMAMAVKEGSCSLVDAVSMRMNYAVMTEKDLISQGQSPYKHQRFPFTPIWCFRRGRDGMPYGFIRRVRDVQEDLNKRASKALFVLSTNQIIGDAGAVEDWDAAREEADRPDGVVVKKKGYDLTIQRDTQMAEGHMKLFEMDALKIQTTSGVNNENMGRQSNSGMSGEAIKSLQLQGSVQTTSIFDNLRYATQVQGEKQLSLIEQYYSEPKVIRLTENKGRVDWVHVNQPEMQADGSVRWLNDITASQADFIVSEQDFHGTLRQAMFENMMQVASKMPPEAALRLLRIAFEYSDFPNKDEITDEIRKLTGEVNPDRKMTPEEMQALEQQRAQAMAMMQQQQEQALAIIAETNAKAKKLNAEADKIIAEVQRIAGGLDGEQASAVETAVREVQARAASEVERVTKQMVHMQGELNNARLEVANRRFEVNKKADVEVQVARIHANAQIAAQEVMKKADEATAPLLKQMEELKASVDEMAKRVDEEARAREKAEKDLQKAIDQQEKDRKEAEKAAREEAKAAKEVKASESKQEAQPTVVFEQGAITVVTGSGESDEKTITVQASDGRTVTATVAKKSAKKPAAKGGK